MEGDIEGGGGIQYDKAERIRERGDILTRKNRVVQICFVM